MNDDPPVIWRVRKASDQSIYGPVDAELLKEWAGSAQIAPEDMIDESNDKWVAAPTIEFLEMHWLIKLPTGEMYGPTSVGTMREFVQEGLVTEQMQVTHAKTHQSLPLAALMVAADFERKRASRRPPRERMKSTATIALDMAKDQHIRQLEEDLRQLRKEHDALTHKYRQLRIKEGPIGRSGRDGD
ncbi:MAG TPA: hypothetical protein VGC34_13415 [Steroidobacteraceae bacterium]